MTTLGVTPRDGGVEVAVFSQAAQAIEFCTFDAEDAETGCFALGQRTGNVFHDFIGGIAAGTRYGLRAHGAFDPGRGHRFNPNKLLLDPYATRLDRPFQLHAALFDTGCQASDTDSAAFMPKGIIGRVESAAAPAPADWGRAVIYELHVRGFSKLNPAVPAPDRGTFAGLAHPSSIDYLRQLGVTAVELLPCAAWVDERHLAPLGLSNYWGYNPIGYCAPDPRLAPGGFADIAACVAALRQAGIATIIDVVFNHSGESDENGPTLSLRGLDNAYYYRLRPDNAALYVNDAGCGNILAADRPGVVQLVMDALRLWVRATGCDGFRFDLAPTLGRYESGFDAAAPLLTAIAQDPLLRDRFLIAEPWDIGAGGYQLGAFGGPWGEWNDRFRDTTRRFWRGDSGMIGDMATRLAGSADLFAASHRPPSRSINFITAHDGFTLRDLVSYTHKDNAANGEQNRDGTDNNYSWNTGVEGATQDAAVLAARRAESRALLATLLLARGTPMLTMGDESGRTQGGNNNAYAQDNALSWLHWDAMDAWLLQTARELIALRLATPALHADTMLRGTAFDDSGVPDVAWLRADGAAMEPHDWENPQCATLIALLYAPPARALLVLNAGADGSVAVPAPQDGYEWTVGFDSKSVERGGKVDGDFAFGARSVAVLVETVPAGVTRATGVSTGTLRVLAGQAGIAADWWDVGGDRHIVSDATLQALLASLRLPAGSEAEARDSLAALAQRRDVRPLPAALVAVEGDTPELRLGPGTGGRDRWLTVTPTDGTPIQVKIAAEDGRSAAAQAADGRRFMTRRVALPVLPAGRYWVTLEGEAGQTELTVAPARCYLPSLLESSGRSWGIAAHLYALRRDNDQGIGDFTALTELAVVAAAEGAALVGLNPVHALFRRNRDRASPYHPADRRFLDPIYIDVAALGALGEAPGVRAALAASGGSFAQLRAGTSVDYSGVWQAKLGVLRAAFDALANNAAESAALDQFIEQGGQALRGFVLWEALVDAQGAQWRDWPAALRAIDAPGIAAFAAANAPALRFSAFLQLIAERGLAASAHAARTAGLDIGLYRDLAVGCAPDGAEAWAEQARLLRGASVGAPPDPIGPLGQVWHLPPPDPLAMAEDGYRSFAALLAVNMRHAGALRIDHVMGLTRLFVVPDGGDARDGAYLKYPLHDLLGQVTLESTRAKCLVVGEDLGTVPPDIRTALSDAAVLSYRVLWFEREGDAFRPPAGWPERAAACVSTHDLPTLEGWWNGDDIVEETGLGRLDAKDAATQQTQRSIAKTQLLAMLRAEGLIGEDASDAAPIAAIHALIARTPAALALAQADDLAHERIGLNLPGTDMERPNWRRRIACTAAAFRNSPVLAAIRAERPASGA